MGVYNLECFTNIAGKYPDAQGYFIPIPCQQCTKPSCVPSCPKDALVKNDSGVIVIVDQELCLDCADKPCVAACPYGGISVDKASGKAFKCDMCEDFLAQDKKPACVGGCLTGSWYYGDFDDPESKVSQILVDYPDEYLFQLKPETGNEPNVYYLLSRQPWNDMNRLYTQIWHED